ncbi:alpha/beta hydrolase [Dietzia aerolata]|uniref:Alpha/beta fold hydrolase n=1 Tax=Dietzia aerolata TaxID=595984 RepID=A0ABV5JNR5_9ACTN|nr:alpha/beta hydrolase [Dietzia aerolata]MBB0968367.1 alpha/beta hydrolase [Dietzia aerolata]
MTPAPELRTTEERPSYASTPTRTVQAGGKDFAYRELGTGSGVPVVFFHHLAATLDNWDPRVIDALALRHRVIAFDQPGVGASTGTAQRTVHAMAEDAHDFLRALGLEQVDVVGFSLGGMVAQVLALTRPTVVRRLVLAGTGPAGGRGIDAVPQVTYRAMLRGALARTDPKEYLFFNRDAAGRQAAREFTTRLKERTTDRDTPITVTVFRAQLAAIKAWSRAAPSDLSRLTHPTLVVNGDHDKMVASILSEDLHRRVPDSRLVIYPNSGHGAIFQHNDQFAREVLTHLANPTTSPGRTP